ncbi:23723_t:CDS:2 [Cetraspora pellucida]|uniref:23723_t:CDS:1 n=1 Tax=Cetraspora pellucida TaxID=1433469 RepID=A0A9N9GSZ5_9GLOM|nr:23723_t:CDS:2 [Cetraspora pellucida]
MRSLQIKNHFIRLHCQFVESDVDEQLILFIPFTGSVKLKSISIKSGPGDSCPSKMKAYINREDIDFDTVDSYTATQEWELISNPDNIEYITRMAKMYNVRNLTLYFPENFGDDVTRIFYIGLKGEWTEIKFLMKQASTPNPADHKNPAEDEKIHHTIN